jgi:short-subunit dehydrogenase
MSYSFHNKVVLITGASSGIGKALADEALQRGAKVAVCARNVEKLKAAFPNVGDDSLFTFQANVADEQDCQEFVKATLNHWQRVDVVLNNAGMSMRALFQDLDLNVIKNLMDINFWGTVYITKAALPSVMANKGVIVGVSSIAGYRGLPGRTGYSSSKFAMQGFLEALRTELLHTGTHIMWVAPGFTASNIRNTALAADGKAQKETPLNEDKLMSAEQCACIILNGVANRKRTIVMTTQGKLTVWLNKLFGGMMDKIVFNHFLKDPDSPLKK